MGRLLVLTVILIVTALPTAAPAGAQSDAAVLDRLMELALQRPSIAGPLRGELPTGLGAIHLQSARVEVRDFYVAATFSNPDPVIDHTWDVGLSFRKTAVDEFRLIVDSDGTWSFKTGLQPIVASGSVPNLLIGPGDINHIDLVAIGNEGYFALNGEYVATLDLSARDASGDVAVGAAYLAGSQRSGESAPYEGFEIWSLDRTSQAPGTGRDADIFRGLMAEATASAVDAGPLSGDLLLEEETIDYSIANVYMRDFYAHALFTNPYPAAEHPWDIGIGFRDPGVQRAFRLVVSSDGEWFLSIGAEPFRVSGQGVQVNTEAGGRNELDLVVKGDTGYLAVNGEYVVTLDLSASTLHGDVWVSSGFFAENTLAGAITEYEDFRVWLLESPETSSEAVDVVVWGNGEVIFDLPEENGSGVSGLVSVVAQGDETVVEIGVIGTAESAQLGIYAGTCDALESIPTSILEPVIAESMSSVTNVDVSFDELTDGGHAIAIRAGADEGEAILACNEIPARDEAAAK